MKNRYIINWELSLGCNLDCAFCSQKERRKKQKRHILFSEAEAIINNLPHDSHISFLGGETLLFPKIIELFGLLEVKGITYEITTNGILLDKFTKEFLGLKNLTKINISIDGFGDFHDMSRGKKGIFEIIINVIPKIIKYTNISISTVITNINNENLIKLYQAINKLKINEQKIVFLMNFTKDDIIKSKKKIKGLKISSPGNMEIDKNYKNDFIRKILILKKIEDRTIPRVEPVTIIKKGNISCKQIDKQFRINEKGNLSICEFIDNDFGCLMRNKFERLIKDREFLDLREKILSNFPLDICKTCCKLYNK